MRRIFDKKGQTIASNSSEQGLKTTKPFFSKSSSTSEKEADTISENIINNHEPFFKKGNTASTTSQIAQSEKHTDQELDESLKNYTQSGNSLTKPVKTKMEGSFGENFDAVKIHSNNEAASMNQQVNAKAFTHGSNIYFNNGQYQPASQEGQKLIAHELSHVVQQRNGNQNIVQRNIFEDLYDSAKEWVTKIYNAAGLWSEMEKILSSSSVNVSKLIKVIKSAKYNVRQTIYNNPAIRDTISTSLSGEKRVRVFSALLSGGTYKPGWESEMYAGMEAAEKDPITKKIDAQFVAETGITRKLKPGSARDMPLIRRWLRIRDEQINAMITAEFEEEERLAEENENYEKYLREGIKKMKDVRFSSFTDIPDLLAGDDVDIPFDKWSLELDTLAATSFGRERQGMLVYNGSIDDAWKGVDELFKPENLKKWAFDCAEFVQAAHLYARRHTFGKDFAKGSKFRGDKLRLAMHYSTAYNFGAQYQRNSATDKFKETLDLHDTPHEVDSTATELINDAPVGSRIVFRNLMAPTSSDFYNENTIKLGNDEFAAHGFDDQKFFTRKELETALGKITYDRKPEGTLAEYVKKNVFIRTIEYVNVH